MPAPASTQQSTSAAAVLIAEAMVLPAQGSSEAVRVPIMMRTAVGSPIAAVLHSRLVWLSVLACLGVGPYSRGERVWPRRAII